MLQESGVQEQATSPASQCSSGIDRQDTYHAAQREGGRGGIEEGRGGREGERDVKLIVPLCITKTFQWALETTAVIPMGVTIVTPNIYYWARSQGCSSVRTHIEQQLTSFNQGRMQSLWKMCSHGNSLKFSSPKENSSLHTEQSAPKHEGQEGGLQITHK